MASETSQTGVFRFFDLPLEMRNLVYDALTTDIHVSRQLSDFGLLIETHVQAPLRFIPILLANRQLSEEYNKQWLQTYGKDVTLAAIDRGPKNLSYRSPDNVLWPSELPQPCAQAVSECKIYAHLWCGVGQCPFHEAVQSVDEFSDEESTVICWAIEMLKPLVERMETSFLPQFANLKQVDFKVAMWWPCEDDEYDFWCHEDYARGRSVEPYATWNREDGWKAGPARGPSLKFLEDIGDEEERYGLGMPGLMNIHR